MTLHFCGPYTPCTSQRRSRPPSVSVNLFIPHLFDGFFFLFVFFLVLMGIYAPSKLSPLPPTGPKRWMSPVDTWLRDIMSMPSLGGIGLGGRENVVVVIFLTPPFLQLLIYAKGTMLLSYMHCHYWLSLCFILSDVAISALLVLVQLWSTIYTLFPP